MKKTVIMKKSGRNYIAIYKTLDLVTQGSTKQEALTNLLDVIVLQIDYAVENKNLENLIPKGR